MKKTIIIRAKTRNGTNPNMAAIAKARPTIPMINKTTYNHNFLILFPSFLFDSYGTIE